jgi:subtilisin family serine protease
MSQTYYGPVLERTGKFRGQRCAAAWISGGLAKGVANVMRRILSLSLAVLIALIAAQPASAQGLLGGVLSNLGSSVSSLTEPQPGVIVRTNLGLPGLRLVCLLHACSVVGNLDGNLGQLYLVRSTNGLLPNLLANTLSLVAGIVDAEPDQVLVIPPNPTAPDTSNAAPAGLWETSPVDYYGTTVTYGYVNQPAADIIRLPQAQNMFHVTGTGIVADIDTGVDPTHPALQGVLLEGWDFTRNQAGGNELNDVNMSAPPACGTCPAAYVNQHTAAMLDQHTAHMLDGAGYEAFGHGTMVLGVIHLVAPTAKLLPAKAFGPDGNGSLSNIIAAVYYSVQNQANVINMSFDMTTRSTALYDALQYANTNHVILVASAGNEGQDEMVYPAGWQQYVMGVASTNNQDQPSSFTNYGDQIVWVAAPGEGVITTYPFGLFAAGWGTSFSCPMVSGTAALVLNLEQTATQNQAALAVAHAKFINTAMGFGRLNTTWALTSVAPTQGLGGLLP